MTLFANWLLSSNVGDNLGPWIIEKLSGQFPVWTDARDVEKTMPGGSILHHAGANTHVWGAGLASMRDSVLAEGLDVCAVRGPLTRAIVLAHGADCPEVYGDPALLVSRLTKINRSGLGKIVVIPHYMDGPRCAWWFENRTDVVVVNPLWPVDRYLTAIGDARGVVSSSLHGLVVADAFGLPRCWVRMSDSLGGDGTKFRDHDMAVGLPLVKPPDCRGGKDRPHLGQVNLSDLPFVTAAPERIRQLQAGLVAACPFALKEGAVK